METTRKFFDKVFENMEKNILNEENGDYISDEYGLVYCGKCHTAKQQMANIGGALRKIPKNCDCRSNEIEHERKEMEEFERSMRINRLKSMAFDDNLLYKRTFEGEDGSLEHKQAGLNYVKHFEDMEKENIGLILTGEVSLGKNDEDKVKAYIGLEKALREVVYLQKEDYTDEEIKNSQDKLNALYDEFSKKYGILNSRSNTKLFREDANYSLISSLEKLDKKGNFVGKSDIFTKRTIRKAVAVEHTDKANDALILSISQKGRVDFDYMQNVTDKTREQLIEELRGEIFLNLDNFDPSDVTPFRSAINNGDFSRPYVTADEYLSENIRDKIQIIDSYIKNIDYEISRNEEYLDKDSSLENEILKTELSYLGFQKQKLLE